MKSASKIFRRSTGLEDVCSKVNKFVTELGKNRLITISTMIEPSSSQKSVGGINVDTSPVDTSPMEYVAIVWYWDAEETPKAR